MLVPYGVGYRRLVHKSFFNHFPDIIVSSKGLSDTGFRVLHTRTLPNTPHTPPPWQPRDPIVVDSLNAALDVARDGCTIRVDTDQVLRETGIITKVSFVLFFFVCFVLVSFDACSFEFTRRR